MKSLMRLRGPGRACLKSLLWTLGVVSLGLAGRFFLAESGFYADWLDMKEPKDLPALLLLAGIYMLLLSIPFLPGIELGVLLMCVVGSKMVMIIYLFTLFGLTLSFAMGRWLPLGGLRFFLRKLEGFLDTSPGTLPEPQTEKILGARLLRYAGKNPYLVTALLLNLPGNFIIGGGGGIAMLSGLNRRISLKYFLLTIAVSTLPLPLLVLFGGIQIERFL